jgi:hypothetical protein
MKPVLKTAYKPDQYNRVARHVKERIRTLAIRAQQNSWTQAKVLAERADIFEGVPEYPRALRTELGGYFDAVFDRIDQEQVMFLYKVKGKFYTTNHDRQEGLSRAQPRGLPTWEALPGAPRIDLSGCGGMYWRHSLEPFFVGR